MLLIAIAEELAENLAEAAEGVSDALGAVGAVAGVLAGGAGPVRIRK